MAIVKGGKGVYGFRMGIIMLETHFPRIPGDVGNASTWSFPVIYKVVKGASPHRVVNEGDISLLEPFIDAAEELEREGTSAITTSCGFLAMFQKEMATAVGVLLFTSSLMMVPLVYRTLKADQKVGILTVNSEALTQRHLEGVGANGVPIALAGLQGGYFSSVVLGDRMEMDVDKAREELVETAKGFVSKNPEVGAIVLECTNMPPFSKSIQGAVGLPVFDIVDLGNMIYHACAKFKYEGTM
ncbi:MAG: hypothetical protein PWP50_271 [Synergistaceae bacterium]|nr:hypothetical protein [Synergistaceae bacterium]